MTATVRIEHTVSDFAAWKTTFDRDPIGREQIGVRSYRITRGTNDRNAVGIDLDFDDTVAASRFQAAIQQLWQSPQARAVLGSSPEIRILEQAESHAY